MWGFLEIRFYSVIMLPSNKPHEGLFKGRLICKNNFYVEGIFEGGLFGGGGLLEDLRCAKDSNSHTQKKNHCISVDCQLVSNIHKPQHIRAEEYTMLKNANSSDFVFKEGRLESFLVKTTMKTLPC